MLSLLRPSALLPRAAFASLLACAALTLAATPQAARAQVLYQPTSATTNMGETFPLNNVINQSGLSTGYVSGTTLNSTYDATHYSPPLRNVWFSRNGTTTGNVDFDLGQSRFLSGMAFWNNISSDSNRITTFTLAGSDNADFSNAISLGNFATATTGGFNVNKETFSFAETSARYVRMNITGNAGGNFAIFGEAAFVGRQAVVPTPEPGSIALLLTAGVPVLGVVRRRKAAG